MKHAHTILLEKLYTDFAEGDLDAVFDACDLKMTFQVPGKSKLAGKFTLETFEDGFVNQLGELSDETFSLDVHDILVSDLHATVLATASLMRDESKIEYRTVHVWRFQGGKPVAWYEYPRDLYQYDQIWS